MAKFPEAHLSPAKGKREQAKSRAFPLGDRPTPAFMPIFKQVSLLAGCTEYRRIINWLDVERAERWLPREERTYCNIYAHDAAAVLGAYLPRVWWSSDAQKAMKAGEKLTPIYPSGSNAGTIRELGANPLHDWFVEFGADFGWQVVDTVSRAERVAAAEKMRATMNATGFFGVISARRKDRNRSGHIVMAFPDLVAPELRLDPSSAPIQSQAGSRNRRIFSTDWYLDAKFDAVVFTTFKAGAEV